MRARRIAAQILSSYLLIWVPATFAIELLSAFSTMGMRGPLAWIELAAHGLAAVTCAVAGRMLRIGTPGAAAFAAAGILARAAVSIQALLWTRLPSSVAPGTRGLLIGVAVVTGLVWLLVLRWTERGEEPQVPTSKIQGPTTIQGSTTPDSQLAKPSQSGDV